jgi:hypothetical protein
LVVVYFIGRQPSNLKIGILNLETENCSYFFNICNSSFLSCNFIEDLINENYSFGLNNFENFENGNVELKKGEISALLVLAQNFSLITQQFNKRRKRKASFAIDVYMDQSNYVNCGFVKCGILQTFTKLNEKLGKCSHGKRPIKPILREDIYGKFSMELQQTFATAGIAR